MKPLRKMPTATALSSTARCLGAALAALLLAGCGSVMNTVRDGPHDRLMLRGNDPVAYFTEGKPVKGDSTITTTHEGLVYRFASAEHKAMFERNPQRFAPAYGGFCASGAPYALKANIGAGVFAIVEDRLYLFGSERSRANWMMDAQENIRRGDEYWEKETRDVPFRLQNLKRYTFKVPGYKTDAELDAEHLRRFGRLPPGAPAPRS